MKKVQILIDVTPDTEERILLQLLGSSLDDIENPISTPMFSYDVDIERKLVKKLRKSFQTVLAYYGHESYDLEKLVSYNV